MLNLKRLVLGFGLLGVALLPFYNSSVASGASETFVYEIRSMTNTNTYRGCKNLFKMYLPASTPEPGSYSFGPLGENQQKNINLFTNDCFKDYVIHVRYEYYVGGGGLSSSSKPFFRIRRCNSDGSLGEQVVFHQAVTLEISGEFDILPNQGIFIEMETGRAGVPLLNRTYGYNCWYKIIYTIGDLQTPVESNLLSKIACSGDHTLRVKDDGSVLTWGANTYGQLGDGTTIDKRSPVQVLDPSGSGNLTNINSVASKGDHSLALKKDGTVWSWGLNTSGQLGNGTLVNSSKPLQVKGAGGIGNLTNVISITTGGATSAVLKSDGTVWTWGYNGYGQLGVGSTTNNNLPVQVKGPSGSGFLSGIIAIASGKNHLLALRNDGTIYAWGYNASGQLGDGTTTNRSIPIQVKGLGGAGYLTDVIKVGCGSGHALAVKNDGSLWAWGNNAYGQLGDGTIVNKSSPIQVKGFDGIGFLSDITGVDGGNNHSLALKSDGTVLSWGGNFAGQLGDGSDINKTTPVLVKNINAVISVASGDEYNFAMRNDNSIWAWGDNCYGQLGDGSITEKYFPTLSIPVPVVISKIACGSYHSIITDSTGSVLAWGLNSSGQLGDATLIDKNLPVPVIDIGGLGQLKNVISVSSFDSHSLAIKNDRTVVAWGLNDNGQLGDNSITNRNSPVQVKDPAGSSVLGSVIKVAAGRWHSLALKKDGTVWAWGDNITGQLGDGTTSDRKLPVQVKGLNGSGYLTNIIAISAGNNFSLAVKNDGTVWAWGKNDFGQLGDGTIVNHLTPIQVKGVGGVGYLTNIVAVACGGGYSIALKNDGTVYCWGLNDFGQLGNGTILSTNTPIQVKGPNGSGFLENIKAISSGWCTRVLALKEDGTMWNWGSNEYGQLGIDSTYQVYPVQVKGTDGTSYLTDVTIIPSSIGYHTIVAKTDKTIWGWGNNTNGQLGIRTNVDKNYPVLIDPFAPLIPILRSPTCNYEQYSITVEWGMC